MTRNNDGLSNVITKIIFAVVLVSTCIMPSVANAAYKLVPQYDCQDDQGLGPAQTTGNPVQLDVPRALTGKIAFYADTERAYSAVGPDGWRCQIVLFLDSEYMSLTKNPIADSTDYFETSQAAIYATLISPDGGLSAELGFYNAVVPLFPKYFPGGLPSYERPIYQSQNEMISDANIEKYSWLGEHDKIIRINDHLLVIFTPNNTNGFAAAGIQGTKFTLPVYSLVGVGNFTGNQLPLAFIIQLRLPSIPDYPIDVLLKLNEQQIENDLARAASSK